MLIDNLPADCCVEVPCVATAGGIEPEPVGALPRHLAALMQTNVNVQGLTVEAALTGRREPVYHAAMLDPAHGGGAAARRDRRAWSTRCIEAHGDWIPPLASAAAAGVRASAHEGRVVGGRDWSLRALESPPDDATA